MQGSLWQVSRCSVRIPARTKDRSQHALLSSHSILAQQAQGPPASLLHDLICLQVEGAFSMEKLSPRLSKNAPPHSGRIMWARCLQERIAGDLPLLKDWTCRILPPWDCTAPECGASLRNSRPACHCGARLMQSIHCHVICVHASPATAQFQPRCPVTCGVRLATGRLNLAVVLRANGEAQGPWGRHLWG